MKKVKHTLKGSPKLFYTFLTAKFWIVLAAIVLIGLYLRFYQIEAVQSFGWDQARDSWIVRDILHGNFPLIGPRTGVGHMHLGPVYYYFLAPFYYFTNSDPMASNYFNIITNVINFFIIFWVSKKIFGISNALFVIFIYSVSHYLIIINQVPWNVTLMPGVATLIFYSILQVYEGKYKWIFILWTLSGFYFNLHFTAIFLPVINILSLAFVKDKRTLLKYTLFSIPLYLIWFLPNIVKAVIDGGGDANLIQSFFKDYFIGFHFRFLLHRLSDSLIMFEKIIYDPLLMPLKYVLPGVFLLLLFFEKDKKKKLLGYMISLWFIIPWIAFSIYGGPLSEYYFLYNAPMVLYVFVYLQQKLLKIKPVPIFVCLIVLWSFYTYQNTKDLWIKPNYGGLMAQRDDAKNAVKRGEVLKYNEGDIKTYFYEIWVKDKKPQL